jgi:NAD(P)-dependent dehydrogenase (short-subunit alcohol dehydrogenase family)
VTGGASGIGLATARRLVAERARVVIGDIDGEAAMSVAHGLGPNVLGRRSDVRDEADVEALFQVAAGAIDVAFANAGIGSFAPIVDADVREWRRVVDVNLIGPLLTIKHAGSAHAERRFDNCYLESECSPGREWHERLLRHQGGVGDARLSRCDGARP